jgi:Zn-dependent peptidase ImmA (M78 family)/transcriptional regulator with XRE-family HTH domain
MPTKKAGVSGSPIHRHGASTPTRAHGLAFNPAQLRLARDLRALPAEHLAVKAGCSLPEIRAFEAGTLEPTHRMLLRLSLVLETPVEFFGAEPTEMPPAVDQCHFRQLRPALALRRRQAVGEIAMLARLLEGAALHIELPNDLVTELTASPTTTDEVEQLAERVRSVWGLGREPVLSVAHAFESHGACLWRLPKSLSALGSFSVWHRGRPFVALCRESSMSSRLDAAHELGHLLMHFEPMPGHPGFERGADRFARAFLLPREAIRAEAPECLDWEAFARLEARWGAPLPVLVERAFEVGVLRESAYLTALAHPEIHQCRHDSFPEEPRLIRRVVHMLADDSLLDGVAHQLGVEVAALRRITEA